MDSFEFNKIAGAILGALFLVLGVGYLAEALFHVGEPETPGYEIEVAEAEGDGHGAADEEPAVNAVALVADADPAAGEKLTRACVACHSFEQGGENKIGPNLYGVMGRQLAAVDGFSYSGAMTDFAGDKVWSFDLMDQWLENPKGLIAGTSMSYAGMRKPEDRAAMLAYLRTLSDSPIDLPAVEQDAAAADTEAPAEEGATDVAAAEGDDAAETATTATAAAEAPAAADDAAEAATDVADADAAEAPTGDAAEETQTAAAEAPAEDAAEETETAAEAPANAPAASEGTAVAEAPAAEEAAASEETAAAEAPAAEEAAATETAAAEEPAETETAAAEAPAAEPAAASDDPAIALIASADPADGKKVSRQCVACHVFEEGGANKIGPALYDVVGRPIAAVDGFKYSSAFKEFADGKTWTYELMSQWLENPKDLVKGNKMVFRGLRKPEDRAAIIAYMRSMSSDPAPLP